MPTPGLPVASTITSTPSAAIIASTSSVTCVVPELRACVNEAAEICSSTQPVFRNACRARGADRSDRHHVNARGRSGLREEHRAKLPSSYDTDPDRPPLGRPIVQTRVQVHGFPPPYDAFDNPLITMLA